MYGNGRYACARSCQQCLAQANFIQFYESIKNSGVNYVNFKVAVIPANDSGKSYGGGNPTLGNAVKTARQPSQQD
jgi:arabinogalactan endo-1,4-beta-galactosidase